MAKTSYDIEKEFMQDIESITGKSLNTWMTLLKEKGLNKFGETQNWLKKEMSFAHMHASLLAGIYTNNGNPVYADTDELLDNQFSGKEHLRSLYDYMINTINNNFPGAQIIPKKTYVSISGKREFAAISIKSKEIRLGMDLGDMPFTSKIQAAKSLGAMPRISHMMQITEKGQLDEEIVNLMKKANERVNS